MIPARKRPAFNLLLRLLLARALRRRFHNVYLAGEHWLDELGDGSPVVGCVNHTNWWDGFVLYLLSYRGRGRDVYLAMEEKNLRRYPFFTWMGAFGVDLSDGRSALPGMRHALRLLRSTGGRQPKLMWMFVQGALTRPAAPVRAKGGASLLARRAGAQLLPVALRYEWLGESRPSIFIKIGAPLASDAAPDVVADALNRLLAEIDHSLDGSSLDVYKPWFAPGLSMNKHWDRFARLFSHRRESFDSQNNLPR